MEDHFIKQKNDWELPVRNFHTIAMDKLLVRK